ncbi:30S ribosomal protein S19 [Trichinella spiralis]|nr:30S ribosomal protein S19 [Trichinella spiralis]
MPKEKAVFTMLLRLLLNENWLRSIPSEVRRWRAINFQLIRSKTEIIDKILHLAHTVVRIDSKSPDGSKTWNDKKLTVNRKNGLLTTNLFNKTLYTPDAHKNFTQLLR